MTSWGRKMKGPTVSFASEDRGRAQPVSVTVRGVEYPGEVVIVNRWEAGSGAPLTASAMFRVVLLDSPNAPQRSDVRDARVGVASHAPMARRSVQGVAESRAAYHAGGMQEESLEAEVTSMREARRRFLTGSDQGLRRLAYAISDQERRAQQDLARGALARWSGAVWTFSDTGLPAGGVKSAPQGVPFIGDDPVAWLEAAAVVLLGHAGTLAEVSQDGPLDGRRQTALWDDISDGRVTQALAAIETRFPSLQDTSTLSELDRLLEKGRGEVFQTALRQRLVHELGIPPALAGLCIAAHIEERDSEIVMATPKAEEWAGNPAPDPPRLIRDQLQSSRYMHDLLDRVGSMRVDVTGDWDSALQYVRVVMRGARTARAGGGAEADEAAVVRTLEEAEGRLTLSFSVLERLEKRLGETARTVNVDTGKLFTVLAARSWQDYFRRARGEFGSVERLRKTFDSARKMGRAGEDALDIERAAAYLAEADFGRADQHIAVEAEVLRSRISLPAFLKSPELWPPVNQHFEMWRRRYARTYAQFHAERRAAARVLRGRVDDYSRKLTTAIRFASIPELGPGPDASLAPRWKELSARVRECPEDGPALAAKPYCEECGARMGAPVDAPELEKAMSEIDAALYLCNAKLSSAAVQKILSGERREDIEKLLKLTAAGDMSPLAGVLTGDVLEFLKQFMRSIPAGPQQAVDK